MDKDHLKVMEQEGVEAPGAEVFKSSIRKSLRLQSNKKSSSCSKYVFKSYQSNSKHTKKSSKASPCKVNSVSEGRIQENKKHQLAHRNEDNSVFSENAASVKFSTVVPSIEYHVQANDGISLVVDLDMKRSDWLKSLGKTVCVSQTHSKPAFESFRKEIECLRERNNLKISSPDKTSASDASMNSCVENLITSKLVSKEIGKTLPSAVEKEIVTVSDSKRRRSKVDKNSELGSFENSEEVQLSDFTSPQKGSLCSRTRKICSGNLLNSATEVNQEADGNQEQSTVDIEERIISTEGMEVSGSEGNASNDGPERKKRNYKSDQVHGQSHERILRSTPVYGGKIIERDGVSVWRSARLHSK